MIDMSSDSFLYILKFAVFWNVRMYKYNQFFQLKAQIETELTTANSIFAKEESI